MKKVNNFYSAGGLFGKKTRQQVLRDISFEEVETEDPVEYVRTLLKGKSVELTAEQRPGGVTVYANCDGLIQEFVFTAV